MSQQLTPREKLIGEVYRSLGGGMVRVELTPDHFDDCVNFALDTYRQRSSNSTQERYGFLNLEVGKNVYDLGDLITNEKVIEVRQVFRRGTTGTTSGTGSNFEPFGAAFVNQMAVGLSGGGGQGSLVTYELFTGFQELVARMFGGFINFTWHSQTQRLELIRDIRSPETILLWMYCFRPEEDILSDTYARPWVLRYTAARCKVILGEARSKFGTFAGPQGGTSMNGDSLKAEGESEMRLLEDELKNQLEQNMGYGWIIG